MNKQIAIFQIFLEETSFNLRKYNKKSFRNREKKLVGKYRKTLKDFILL